MQNVSFLSIGLRRRVLQRDAVIFLTCCWTMVKFFELRSSLTLTIVPVIIIPELEIVS